MKKEGLNPENELLRRFREALLAQNKSDATIEKYLRVASEYLAVNADHPEPFQREHVNRFLASKRLEGCCGNTMRNQAYVVKKLFKVLGKPYPLAAEELPEKSTPHQPMFTPEGLTRMEMVAEKRGPRDYAIIMLENTAGLRRTEIRSLDVADYERPWLRVETGKKGRKVRRELDGRTCDALDSWIKIRSRKRRQEDPDALFIRGTHGPRLSLSGLSHIIKTIREEAGIEKMGAGFHATRRRVITDLHERGISGAELTREWGWESANTVQTYLKLSKRKVEDKIRSVSPRFQRPEEEGENGSGDLADEEVLKVLRGLSPKAQRNVAEMLRNPPAEVEA